MNSTIRTINRVVLFFGALVAGILVTSFGYRTTLGFAAVAFAAATAVVWISPLRSVRVEHAAALQSARRGRALPGSDAGR